MMKKPPLTNNFNSIRTQVESFYNQNKVRNPYSLTLTMKQKIEGETIFGGRFVDPLDGIKSQTNLRYFRNRLNKKIFGNSYYRFKKQLQMFSILERDTNHRFHYHLIIEKPDHLTDDEFKFLIWDSWNKTTFGYHQIHLVGLQLYDENYWFRYLIKKRTKFNLCENRNDHWFSIDWENCTNFQTSMS